MKFFKGKLTNLLFCAVLTVVFLVLVYLYALPILIHQNSPLIRYDDHTHQGAAVVVSNNPTSTPAPTQTTTQNTLPTKDTSARTLEEDNFTGSYTLAEDWPMEKSNSSTWWVSSGGYLYSKNGVGGTIQGELSALNPRRVAYLFSNSLDTDDGYRPQNIFRMVNKGLWKDVAQEVYFYITNNNLSESPNRNASNGLLLFNRYQDEFNLYYTGIRVDGYAVIKKKINKEYYTMAYEKLFDGPLYDRNESPTLLPKSIWIGLRSEVETNPDDTVAIRLYMDYGHAGGWALIAEATDDGESYGGAPFHEAGHGGIRTDFMDVLFDDYSVQNL